MFASSTLERTASNFNASASSGSRARARKARGSSGPLAKVGSIDHSEKIQSFIYVICGYGVYAIYREIDEGTCKNTSFWMLINIEDSRYIVRLADILERPRTLRPHLYFRCINGPQKLPLQPALQWKNIQDALAPHGTSYFASIAYKSHH